MSNIVWQDANPGSILNISADTDIVIVVGPNASRNRCLFGAASALLDALKDLAGDCEYSASASIMDAARAAIAKAEGR